MNTFNSSKTTEDIIVHLKNRIYENVQERELTSLLKASADLGCSGLKVTTWDQEADTVMDGNRIEFVPLWRWLTEDRSA